MESLKFNGHTQNYDVYIDNSISSMLPLIKKYTDNGRNKLFIITDSVVFNLYHKQISQIEKELCCKVFNFQCGEENKTMDTIAKIYEFLLENNANRNSILMALGGGVVGDLVGYAAATFMRGIRYIGVPTTLISQVDSCLGGKVGFNYRGLKNVIGNFYDPIFVYVDICFLSTLDKEQFLSGIGEVLKYGLVEDKQLISYIENYTESILNLEEEKLMHIVKNCLNIKAHVIAEDYNDLGIRNMLNFGHTAGHALELESKYKISHGIAVALGILVSIRISINKFGISEDIYSKVEGLYTKLGIPTRYKVDNYTSFLYAINRDKKNDDSIRFVLLKDIGESIIKVKVDENEIIEAIKHSIGREEV